MKKCTKKRDARAKLLFCVINLLVFLDVLAAVAVVVAKAPYTQRARGREGERARGIIVLVKSFFAAKNPALFVTSEL